MNEEISTLWTEALRSKKFSQGKIFLQILDKTERRFCCLGVLCELYQDYCRKNGKEELNAYVPDKAHFVVYNNSTSGLPSVVKEWAGLKHSLGEFTTPKGGVDSLSGLNDSGSKFEEIANFIENNWKIL
jgi:hypothetical protein